jgi:hypothetical protein
VYGPYLLAVDYAVRVEQNTAPKQLAEAVSKELEPAAIQFVRDGEVVCNLWLCKEISSTGTPAQAKNGLSYRELKEGSLLGAMEIVKPGFTDYRKQKIATGVYSLRLGFQPMDGDHMGTAPYGEFCVLLPAADDKKPDTMEAKDLQDASAKATSTGHPAVLLLFPNDKPAAAPKFANKGEGNWVLSVKLEAKVGAEKTPFGVGLVLVGHSPSV